jgi:tetratricopeptide (TPR) repeat protein
MTRLNSNPNSNLTSNTSSNAKSRASLALLAAMVSLVAAAPRAEAKLAELLVTDGAGLKAIELETADVKATIDYTTARVTYDLSFVSQRPGNLEGTFYFALPRGAYVHEFGMWLDGNYQGSAVVEAQAGRVAYESIVRRGVDPALLEWTAGNNFKMRVFPVVKGKPSRIVLTVGMPLEMTGGKLRASVPLDFGKVETLKLAVEGRVRGDEMPELNGLKGLKLAEVKVKDDDGDVIGFSGKYEEKDLLPPDALVLTAEEEDADDVKVRREDGDEARFFEAHAFPTLGGSLRPKAEHAVVYWDYSLSEEDHREARLESLGRYLKARKPATLEIWGFNQQVFPVAKELKGSDVKGALAAVAKYPYDGGTRLDRLIADLKAAAPKWKGRATDLVVLTNGVDSFELFDTKTTGDFARSDLAAYLIAPATGANATLLGVVAKMFGAVILDQDEDLVPEAFTAMPWTVASVKASKSLTEVVNAAGTQLFPGDGLVVRGRVKRDGKAEVVTTLAQGKKTKTVTWSFDTEDVKREKTHTVPRLWAQQRILELAAAKRSNAATIRTLAIEHQLMSPETVMVVLEWCDDYREFKLPPPKDCRTRPADMFMSEGGEEDDVEVMEDAEEESADAGSDGPMDAVLAPPSEAAPTTASAAMPPPVANPSRAKAKSVDFDSADIGGQRKTPMGAMIGAEAAGSDDFAAAEDGDEADLEEIIEEMDGDEESASGSRLGQDTPDRRYGFETLLDEAAAGGAEKLYAKYLATRGPFAKIPYYYVYAAEAFAKTKRLDLADLVLSNVVEVRPGDARWLRIYAYDLVAWGKAADAIPVYRAVTELRGEDPQSFRDFGLALESVGQPVLAMRLFEKVYKGKWDDRLAGMSRIILHDLARAAGKALRTGGLSAEDLAKAKQYARVDPAHGDKLVVTVSWDTDGTDIDLHVVEPGGKHVYYGNQAPAGAAGKLSWDSTQGFGPEQYRAAMPYRGAYRVALQYFADNPVALADGTFVRIDFKLTESGVTREWTQSVFLSDPDTLRTVATVEVKDPASRVAPPDFGVTLSVAKQALEKGQFTEALSLLTRAGPQPLPRHEAQRMFHMGRAQLRLKQYAAAEESNQRALASDPSLLAAHYNNACAASLAKDARKAALHLNMLADALKRDPSKRSYFARIMKTDNDLVFARSTAGYRAALDRIVVGH